MDSLRETTDGRRHSFNVFKTLGLLFAAGMMVVAFIYLPKTVLKKKGIEAEEKSIAQEAEEVLLVQPGEATAYKEERSSEESRTNHFEAPRPALAATPIPEEPPSFENLVEGQPDSATALKAVPVHSIEASSPLDESEGAVVADGSDSVSPQGQPTDEPPSTEKSGLGPDDTIGLFFDFGQSRLTSSAVASADRVADFLNSRPDLTVKVTGFADRRGNENYNKILARARAEKVVARLVEKGVSKSRVTRVGGDLNRKLSPLTRSEQAEPKGEARFRRVEISFNA